LSPLLIVHISAGSLAILSGAAAVSVRKGERLHRRFGAVFLVAMLIMSALGAYLAARLQLRAPAVVGVFTFYLVATALATVRRKAGTVGLFEKAAFLVASSAAAALGVWGMQAAISPTGRLDGAPPAPYFVFAAFAAVAAILDFRMIRRGGVSGSQRIARHLWRMCFALFFATSFFFLAQQKVMPAFMHGSPILLAPAFAPLAVMIFWLVRVLRQP
jgi:uncharacterized membrane protein